MISKALFAALIGREADPELKTLVKSGAYYTIEVSTQELAGIDPSESFIDAGCSKSKFGSTLEPHDTCTLKYKPSSEELAIHCGSVLVW